MSTFGVVLDTWLLLLSLWRCLSFAVDDLAALMRRIGCEQDFPSAQVESGHPHSSCLTSAAWRAARCFSINWPTIASTVSAVLIKKNEFGYLLSIAKSKWILTVISISLVASGSSSLKTKFGFELIRNSMYNFQNTYTLVSIATQAPLSSIPFCRPTMPNSAL